jgi:hypothetical protein
MCSFTKKSKAQRRPQVDMVEMINWRSAGTQAYRPSKSASQFAGLVLIRYPLMQRGYSYFQIRQGMVIEILHIRSFFHPFSNQNPEQSAAAPKLGCRILFRYVLSVALQLPYRRPFYSRQMQQSKRELGRCLPLCTLDFSPSTSPSPIHLL